MALHLGKKVTFNGITFDSQSECSRYKELRLLERIGEISRLLAHPRIPIEVEGRKICDIIPDFIYLRGGDLVVEDVKGNWKGVKKTKEWAIFRLKVKLFEAIYDTEITVIFR